VPPIVEVKRAQIVKSDFALNESIHFIPTPGHTIDHYSVLVGQPGRDALITGDMIHAPIQGKYPELSRSSTGTSVAERFFRIHE
jgi:glyoxylase-like metal-dependent hydrolase (beta-lactamase superfamily II)